MKYHQRRKPQGWSSEGRLIQMSQSEDNLLLYDTFELRYIQDAMGNRAPPRTLCMSACSPQRITASEAVKGGSATEVRHGSKEPIKRQQRTRRVSEAGRALYAAAAVHPVLLYRAGKLQ